MKFWGNVAVSFYISIPALSDAALLLKSQKEHLLFVSVLTDGEIAPRGPKRGDIKTKKTKISKCRRKKTLNLPSL